MTKQPEPTPRPEAVKPEREYEPPAVEDVGVESVETAPAEVTTVDASG